MATETAAKTEEAPGIEYIYYVTTGWLLATAIAIVLLMLVIPSLF